MQGVSSNEPLVSVSTFLTALERARVDAAGEGSYRAIHRDGVADVVGDIKARREELGANAFLAKPCPPATLVAAVHAAHAAQATGDDDDEAPRAAAG